MFKRQYRVYPVDIYLNGDVSWQIQHRIFPFWWTGLVINKGFIYRSTKEAGLQFLSLVLKEKRELERLQEKNKDPL